MSINPRATVDRMHCRYLADLGAILVDGHRPGILGEALREADAVTAGDLFFGHAGMVSGRGRSATRK